MINKEIKEILTISEKFVKTKVNFTLFDTKDNVLSEKKGENFIFKYSKSKLHNTDYLINTTYYKTIMQNFTIPEEYEEI